VWKNEFLTNVIVSSFSHFDLDEEYSPGLLARIAAARAVFPSSTKCVQTETVGVPFIQLGTIVRKMARKVLLFRIATRPVLMFLSQGIRLGDYWDSDE